MDNSADEDDDDEEDDANDDDEESGEDNLFAAYDNLQQEAKDKKKNKDGKELSDDEIDAKKAMDKNPFLRYGTGI